MTPHHWSWSSAAVHSVSFYNDPGASVAFDFSFLRRQNLLQLHSQPRQCWSSIAFRTSLSASHRRFYKNLLRHCIEDYKSRKPVLLVTWDQVRGRSEVSSVASYSGTCVVPNEEVCCASLALQILCPVSMTSKRRSRTKVKRAAIQRTLNNPIKSDLQTHTKAKKKKVIMQSASTQPTWPTTPPQNIKASHVPETATKTKPNLTFWIRPPIHLNKITALFWTRQKRVKNYVFWWGKWEENDIKRLTSSQVRGGSRKHTAAFFS